MTRRETRQDVAATATAATSAARNWCAGIIKHGLIWFQSHQISVTIKRRTLKHHLHCFVALVCRHLAHVWRAGRNDKRQNVMDDFRIGRARFGVLDVFIFGEICWDIEILIFVRAGLVRVLFRNGEDHIRFGNIPARDKGWRLRHIFGIAFFGATINPRDNRLNFFGG